LQKIFADFIQKVLPKFSKGAMGKIGTKLIVSKVERDGNKGATVLEFSPYFNESPGGMDKLALIWEIFDFSGLLEKEGL
jgi:hypothetical protein